MKHLAALLLISATALSACGQQAEQTPATATEAAPDAKPGLALSDGRLVLPAVKGNPAAAYFVLSNGGSAPATLAAVAVNGAARAEMHETTGESMAPLPQLALAPGETATFKPGGKHVMAFELDPKLAVGGSTEITLTFADGDKLSAPLKIEPAGGAMEHMH